MWRLGTLPSHSSHYYYYYYLYYYYCYHQTTIESSTSTWKPQKPQGINGNPDHHTHQWTPFNFTSFSNHLLGSRSWRLQCLCVWSKPSEEELRLSLPWFFFFPFSFPTILFSPPTLYLELLRLAPLSTFLPLFSCLLQPLNPVPALQTPKTLTPTQLLWVLRIYIFTYDSPPPFFFCLLVTVFIYHPFIFVVNSCMTPPFLPLMAFMTQ